MIGSTLSRRVALGGLLAVPALGFGRASAAAPACEFARMGAVQLSGASTVCFFTAQTTADGTASSVGFTDFKIAEVKAGATVEKLFVAYHTFAAPAGTEPSYLRRIGLTGFMLSEGVSGTARVDIRIGGLGGQRSWDFADREGSWVHDIECRRRRLRPGEVLPITVKLAVRVASVAERSRFSFNADSLGYVHAPL